jgi:tetratricopeptide (TPR) repeat protein
MYLRFSSVSAGVEYAQAVFLPHLVRSVPLLVLVAMSACTSLPKGEPAKAGPEAINEEAAVAGEEFERALTLLGAGDLEPAVQMLESLAVSHPGYAGPFLNLGIAYSKSGQWAEAEQAIKMAIVRRPDSAVAYNQLGIVYRKLGRFLEAAGAYQRALEIQPDYALAHLNLGVLYDVYLQQPDKALSEFERYVVLAGDSDAVVSGWIKEIKARLGAAARATRSEA